MKTRNIYIVVHRVAKSNNPQSEGVAMDTFTSFAKANEAFERCVQAYNCKENASFWAREAWGETNGIKHGLVLMKKIPNTTYSIL